MQIQIHARDRALIGNDNPAMGRPRKKLKDIDDATYPDVARRFRVLLALYGGTSSDLAGELGIPPTRLSNYATGVSQPRPQDAIKIKRFFNVTLDWLYEGDTSTLSVQMNGEILRSLASFDGQHARQPSPKPLS